jgi:hypothetical protein
MNFSRVSEKTLIGKALRFPLELIPRGKQMRILQGPLHGKDGGVKRSWLLAWNLRVPKAEGVFGSD